MAYLLLWFPPPLSSTTPSAVAANQSKLNGVETLDVHHSSVQQPNKPVGQAPQVPAPRQFLFCQRDTQCSWSTNHFGHAWWLSTGRCLQGDFATCSSLVYSLELNLSLSAFRWMWWKSRHPTLVRFVTDEIHPLNTINEDHGTILNPIKDRTAERCKICPWTLVIKNHSFGSIILLYFSSLASEEREVTVYNAPQTFNVGKWGPRRHNIRAWPSLKALPVGKLKLGRSISRHRTGREWVNLNIVKDSSNFHVFQQRRTAEGVWTKLLPPSALQYCFTADVERLGLSQSIAIKWFTCATYMTYCRVSA